jgi:hypothetical protein
MLFNPLKRSVTYVLPNLPICNVVYCIYELYGSRCKQRFISLNGINHLLLVMVKCGVLFEVRTEFLNII